ncbi:hypothetical protein BLA29_009758, partial [Euroglyphus maynei]
ANTPVADRLIARVCQHRQIQSSVKKFRLENPGCEQWLPVQIELWEEKRQNKVGKSKKVENSRKDNGFQKVKNSNESKNVSKEKKQKLEPLPTPKIAMKKSPLNPRLSLSKKSKSFTPTFQVTPLNDNKIVDSIKTKSAVIKRIDLSSISDKILDDNEDDDSNVQEKAESPRKNKKTPVDDGFFLAEQNIEQDFIRMHDASDDDNVNVKSNYNKPSTGYKKKFSFDSKPLNGRKQN